MSSKAIYYSKAPLNGAGKLHFLITPQVANEGTAPRALLGSLVEDIGGGLLGKDVPGFDHVWKREYVLGLMKAIPELAGNDLINETSLASVSQDLKVNKKLAPGISAPIPGVPAVASIEIDYSKIVSIKLTLGAGSRKLYIPTGFLKSAYAYAEANSGKVDPQLFDDDYLAVSQIVLVKKLELSFESTANFSAGFDAKADDVTNMKVGVKYEKTTERKYTVKIDDGNDYLFALRGEQLEGL